MPVKMLNVPYVGQPKNSDWCWAACALMVLKHYKPDCREEIGDVVGHYGGTGAGCSGMSMLYLMDKNIKPTSRDTQLNKHFIVFCLDNDSPYVITYTLNAGTNHMVVVTGYETSSYGACSFYVKDPAEAQCARQPFKYSWDQLLNLGGQASGVIDGFGV